MTELRSCARRYPVPWINIGFHLRYELALCLEKLDQRIAPRQAGEGVSLTDVADPGQIGRISRLQNLARHINDARALQFGHDERAIESASDAHWAMQSGRDHVQVAGSADADQLSTRDRVPRRKRENRLLRPIAMIDDRKFILG